MKTTTYERNGHRWIIHYDTLDALRDELARLAKDGTSGIDWVAAALIYARAVRKGRGTPLT